MLALIDEILAGIFLGPSVMGIILPSFVSFVSPQYSLTSLDLSHLKGKAVAISTMHLLFCLQPDDPIVSVLVILIAIAGKIGGGSVFSRLFGQSWEDSLFIGTMHNTRGLMESIVLNIGYDLNIIGIELYAIMVLMALATTFLKSPLILYIENFSVYLILAA